MRRTEVYQIRLDILEKKQAFAVFKQLGISPAQAIRLFFRQVVMTRSIPFPIEHGQARIEELEKPKKPLTSTSDSSTTTDLVTDKDVFDQLDELLKSHTD